MVPRQISAKAVITNNVFVIVVFSLFRQYQEKNTVILRILTS
jgi:hypothetical protein